MIHAVAITGFSLVGLFALVVALNEVEDAIAARRRKHETRRPTTRTAYQWDVWIGSHAHCMPGRSQAFNSGQVATQKRKRKRSKAMQQPQPLTVHDLEWIVSDEEIEVNA